MLKLLILCLFTQITISDQIPPPVHYPRSVYAMTIPEYYQWATNFNLEQVKKLPKVYAPKWLNSTETDIGSTVETYGNNGGCGYGNYCGQGGYMGYGLSLINTQSVTFPRRWLNPDYVGPGKLIILNPYCRPKFIPKGDWEE
jgi:hypothetical protein